MSLLNVMSIILLTGLFQHAQGEKVVASSKGRREVISCTIMVAEHGGKDEHVSSNSSCECCICNTSCACSLYCALQKANGISNVMINVTTDVKLSSPVQLMNINNITIIGYNNPTVKLNNTGALYFTLSHDIRIQEIEWERCGTNRWHSNPGLKMYNCSGINIINSSFKYFTTQSLVLNNVSGSVTIDHCNFMASNLFYHGHGAAIHYSSMNGGNMFAINHCKFSYYRAKSVVCIDGKPDKGVLHLKNLEFSLNQAVSLYVMNCIVCISEDLRFEDNYNQVQNGGGIYVSDHAEVIFDYTSNVIFSNNTAKKGSAMYISNTASVMFKGKCLVTDNNAISDGTLYANNHSSISFMKQSKVTFTNNKATQGGAIYLHGESNLVITSSTCKEKCQVLFKDNRADFGGAIYHRNSNVTFTGCPDISFHANKATLQGGAIYSHSSYVIFEQNSSVHFIMNVADSGGAMHTTTSSHLVFHNDCIVRLYNNKASSFGGAIFIYGNSDVTFDENSYITFTRNRAGMSGAIFVNNNCSVEFLNATKVLFNYNRGVFGGAILVARKSIVIFRGNLNSSITFINNTGGHGGALCSYQNSMVVFEAESSVEFSRNRGYSGGALYSINSYTMFNEACTVTLTNNVAKYGGVFYSHNSITRFTGNSSILCTSNRAIIDGGVMYLTSHSSVSFNDNSNVTFSSNSASDYGGSVYINLDSNIVINTTNIKFHNSIAAMRESTFHINVQHNCNDTCLTNYIVDKHLERTHNTTTSPYRVELRNPARCIHSNNDSVCDEYYINDIMLGQEIIINGCVYDYYNQPTKVARLLDISSDNKDYIHDSNSVLISCNHTFQGISVTGNINASNTLPSNITMNLTLHFDRRSESNFISVNLTVGLSPCHPGFLYDASSSKCECYNTGDVVFCSDSNSTIRRGYWFGSVNGKPTVAYCPINYCNFTCCETTNGFYHLSPMRKNQCALHRNGTACGNCEDGYTLSFDSAMCIQVDSCTAGQKALIIISTILYWIFVVVAAFVLMHCQVTVGYLYAIIYYYSVMDLLLSYINILYISGELCTMVSVLSSIAKLLPQFLGQLCLVENMDEIDQQFIHYIHPLAVSFILVIISCLAKCSYRVSSFISKDIIRVICLLLLLSYTSVATTSLLMLQPLKFLDVDEMYSYLSPDIHYFQGRHLVYGLVAILCTIVIVIGLPLLLLLEPFLNSKISFVKIKPFLDQFQGCYKDKYRCFAGYYMICRVIIIVIIITHSSGDFYSRYVLITLCTITALIHLIVRPYASNILNMFDGLILQLMVFVVSAFDVDDHYSSSLTGTVYIIVIMPVILFCIMELFIYRVEIKKIGMAVCRVIYKSSMKTSKTDVSINDIDLTIGDTLRRSRGTTVCEM